MKTPWRGACWLGLGCLFRGFAFGLRSEFRRPGQKRSPGEKKICKLKKRWPPASQAESLGDSSAFVQPLAKSQEAFQQFFRDTTLLGYQATNQNVQPYSGVCKIICLIYVCRLVPELFFWDTAVVGPELQKRHPFPEFADWKFSSPGRTIPGKSMRCIDTR